MKAGWFKAPPLLACLLLAAFALSACRGHQQVTAAPAKPPAAKNPDEMSKQIPSDLYKEMPIYPGAQVVHVRKPKGAMREIVFQAGGSPTLNQMVDFYKGELKKDDFRITSSLVMPARKTWSCDFHKEGRPGSIMLYPNEKDKSVMDIDLIYEMPSKVDQTLLEPKEDFDVIGPGKVAQKAPNEKVKRN